MPHQQQTKPAALVSSQSRLLTRRVVEFIAERTCLACGQRRALTTGQHQYQRYPNDASESASAEEKIETRLPYATIERLYEEFKRRIKIQTVLPSAETAAISFWALLASGRVTMRKVDGWRSLLKKPSDKIIELAARGGNIVTPGDCAKFHSNTNPDGTRTCPFRLD